MTTSIVEILIGKANNLGIAVCLNSQGQPYWKGESPRETLGEGLLEQFEQYRADILDWLTKKQFIQEEREPEPIILPFKTPSKEDSIGEYQPRIGNQVEWSGWDYGIPQRCDAKDLWKHDWLRWRHVGEVLWTYQTGHQEEI